MSPSSAVPLIRQSLAERAEVREERRERAVEGNHGARLSPGYHGPRWTEEQPDGRFAAHVWHDGEDMIEGESKEQAFAFLRTTGGQLAEPT